jgi:hypothetical protein
MADHEGATIAAPDLGVPDFQDGPAEGGGWGAQLAAKLELSIGKVTAAQDATTAELRNIRREARTMPALVKLSSAFQYSTGANAQMCQQGGIGSGVLIGGPELGMQWVVRQVVVGGVGLATAWTGTAFLLVSAAPPNELSVTSVADSIAAPTAGPAVRFYSNEQMYLQPNENLYLVIVGGTNNLQTIASVSYQASPFVPRGTEVNI